MTRLRARPTTRQRSRPNDLRPDRLRPVVGRDFCRRTPAPQRASRRDPIAQRSGRCATAGAASMIGRTVRINASPVHGDRRRCRPVCASRATQASGCRSGPPAEWEKRDSRNLTMFGRLAPGAGIRSPAPSFPRSPPIWKTNTPSTNRDIGVLGRTYNEHFTGRNTRLALLALARCGGIRAPDRVRECRQSVAVACGRAHARDLDPDRPRRGPMAGHPATAHRERHAVGGRRPARDAASDGGACACSKPSSSPRTVHRISPSTWISRCWLPGRDHPPDRHPVRPCASAAACQNRGDGVAQRRRPGTRALEGAGAG